MHKNTILTICQYLKSEKGMALPIVMIIFIVAFLVSFSLILRQGTHIVNSTKRMSIEKAGQLADAGVELAIGYLRSNPNYERKPADNELPGAALRDTWHKPISLQLNDKGKIVLTVIPKQADQEAIVISSGIYSPSGDFTPSSSYKQAVRAVLNLESPGKYFCASTNKFVVGAGAQMQEGDGIIYGNILEFIKPNGAIPIASVYWAQYAAECIPPHPELGADPYVIFSADHPNPEDVPTKVLPVLSKEFMKWYYDIAYNDDVDSSFLDTSSDGTMDVFDDDDALKIPETYGAGKNKKNIWYFPPADPITDPVPVKPLKIQKLTYDFYDDTEPDPEKRDKSCIVVVNGDLYIESSILNKGFDDLTKKYAIAFIVNGNVCINIDSPFLPDPVEFQRTLFIATNGKFTVSIAGVKTKDLKFSGAALFRESFDLERGFINRSYAYDPLVQDIMNLPFIVSIKIYQIIPAD